MFFLGWISFLHGSPRDISLTAYKNNLLVALTAPQTSDNGSKKDSDEPKKVIEKQESKLKTLLEGEAKRQGLYTGIVSSIVFLYSSISDLILHPILIVVLAILTIGVITLATLMFIMLKREDFSTLGKLASFGIIYFLIYIDLLFIIYEQKKITLMFFSLDKDILLILLTTIAGYFIGKYSSRKVFEDKVLP